MLASRANETRSRGLERRRRDGASGGEPTAALARGKVLLRQLLCDQLFEGGRFGVLQRGQKKVLEIAQDSAVGTRGKRPKEWEAGVRGDLFVAAVERQVPEVRVTGRDARAEEGHGESDLHFGHGGRVFRDECRYQGGS